MANPLPTIEMIFDTLHNLAGSGDSRRNNLYKHLMLIPDALILNAKMTMDNSPDSIRWNGVQYALHIKPNNAATYTNGVNTLSRSYYEEHTYSISIKHHDGVLDNETLLALHNHHPLLAWAGAHWAVIASAANAAKNIGLNASNMARIMEVLDIAVANCWEPQSGVAILQLPKIVSQMPPEDIEEAAIIRIAEDAVAEQLRYQKEYVNMLWGTTPPQSRASYIFSSEDQLAQLRKILQEGVQQKIYEIMQKNMDNEYEVMKSVLRGAR